MDPGSVFRKFLKKHSRGGGAAPASAGVHDVGDAGADHVEIFLVERQPPEFFSGALERAGEVLVNVFIVGKDTGVHAAQRDNAGAGESGSVYEMGAAEGAGIMQAVGQDKPAFSVSIDDLNGLA